MKLTAGYQYVVDKVNSVLYPLNKIIVNHSITINDCIKLDSGGLWPDLLTI